VDLTAIRTLVEQGKQKRKTQDSIHVRDLMDSCVKELNELSAKLKSSQYEIDKVSEEQTQHRITLNELMSVSEHLPAEQVDAARNELETSMGLSNARMTKLKVEHDRMTKLVSIKTGDREYIEDKLKSLTEPNYTRVCVNVFNRMGREDILLLECRKDIRDFWAQVVVLEREIGMCPDKDEIRMTLCLQGARMQQYQRLNGQTITPQGTMSPGSFNTDETTILRRCFGIMKKLRNDTDCGYVDTLMGDFPDPKFGWDVYIKNLESEIAARRKRRADKATSDDNDGNQKKNDPEPIEEETIVLSKDLAFANEIRASLNLTKGRRVVVFGGEGKEHQKLAMFGWVQDSLQLECVDWFDADKSKSMLTSIEMVPPDLVVMFVAWMNHPAFDVTTKYCRQNGIRTISCRSLSKTSLCRLIIKALSARGDIP